MEAFLSAIGHRRHRDGLSDDELIALARKQRLFRIARGLVRDDHEAEDIVQETYVRAFTALDTFRGDAAFSTWLTRITLNEAHGRIRRTRPMVELAEVDGADTDGAEMIMFPLISAEPSPEAETGREQVRRLLEDAVDRLPEPFRLVFILRDIEGLGTEAAAMLLSIKPETVKTLLFRARRLLRVEMEKALQPHSVAHRGRAVDRARGDPDLADRRLRARRLRLRPLRARARRGGELLGTHPARVALLTPRCCQASATAIPASPRA